MIGGSDGHGGATTMPCHRCQDAPATAIFYPSDQVFNRDRFCEPHGFRQVADAI